MQPTLRCYFCNCWLRERLKRIGASIVCCRAEESVVATEVERFVRPCHSAVSVVKRSATLFRFPDTVANDGKGQRSIRKGLTVLVKPFLVQLKPSRCRVNDEQKGASFYGESVASVHGDLNLKHIKHWNGQRRTIEKSGGIWYNNKNKQRVLVYGK